MNLVHDGFELVIVQGNGRVVLEKGGQEALDLIPLDVAGVVQIIYAEGDCRAPRRDCRQRLSSRACLHAPCTHQMRTRKARDKQMAAP